MNFLNASSVGPAEVKSEVGVIGLLLRLASPADPFDDFCFSNEKDDDGIELSSTNPGPYCAPGGKTNSICFDAIFQAAGPRSAAYRARLLAYEKGS